MANLLPQPDQPLLPPNQLHQSFGAFYGDASLDPCSGDYTRIMDRFDPEVNPAISHVTLLERAIGSGPVPQAYLCCVERSQQTKIICLHLPSKYTGSLDGRQTPWDGISFAFLGEVTQGQATTVILPDTAFRATGNIRAKTADFIMANIDTIGAYGWEPIAADEPDATQVVTRTMMYLPARYVPLLLNPSGYTLRQTWEVLYTAIVAANDAGPCTALINWLRVATTSAATANDPTTLGPSRLSVTLQAPLADEQLITHRLRILKTVLPGLYRPPQALEQAITQMAVAVTHNTNETRIAREEKAARQAEPKLPSDRFTVTLAILQNYLQIGDEINLPPLWHKLANCTKKQDFNVLSEMLHVYSRSQDKFSSCAPIASTKLVQDIVNFNFVSETLDDIKTGIQPFIIADASAEHRQQNLEIARTFGLLNSGEHALLLSDLTALQAKEVQSIPLTYFELERNLGMFGNLLGTVLGNTHVLTVKYREFWGSLSQAYRQELQHLIDNRRYVKPVHVLRSVQLICYNWFTMRRAQLTPLQPDFGAILQSIVLNTYVLPSLPPALYRLTYPRQQQSTLPALISTSSASGSSGTGSSGTGTTSDSSIVSGLTTPTLVSSTGQLTRSRGSHIANLNPDARLLQLVDPGVRVKDLMGSDPPPSLDNGNQICLSYLLRQGCWSTCRRANTHGQALNDNEHARLVTYLTTQMQKLRAASAASATPPTRG